MAYLGYDGVDFAVDSDAAVPGPLAGLLREPVVAVPASQHLHQRQPELLQLFLVDVAAPQLNQVNHKVGGGL